MDVSPAEIVSCGHYVRDVCRIGKQVCRISKIRVVPVPVTAVIIADPHGSRMSLDTEER